MENDNYISAKEMFIKNLYRTKFSDNQKQMVWDSYNVPQESILQWVKEHLNELASEIDDLLLNEKVLTFNIKSEILINMSLILHVSYDYKINYSKEIVNLLEKIDNAMTLGSAVTLRNMWDRRILNISLLLSDKEKDKKYLFFDDYYYFDTKDKYFGLLPYLYQMKEYELFNKLFDIIYRNIDLYNDLNYEKGFTVSKMLIEYAKYMNMDCEKYINKNEK